MRVNLILVSFDSSALRVVIDASKSKQQRSCNVNVNFQIWQNFLRALLLLRCVKTRKSSAARVVFTWNISYCLIDWLDCWHQPVVFHEVSSDLEHCQCVPRKDVCLIFTLGSVSRNTIPSAIFPISSLRCRPCTAGGVLEIISFVIIPVSSEIKNTSLRCDE